MGLAAGEGKPDIALKESLSALLFIEMLFWKNAHDSGEVREEYRWRVSLCASTQVPILEGAALTEHEQSHG